MKINLKRKRQGKTDYKARMIMLKSGKLRVVIRKTNRYLDVQLIKSEEAKDKIIVSTSSKELMKKGWPKNEEGSLKSIPAGYLTGYLAGKKIIEKENKKPVILDIGLGRNTKGSRVYSVLNGLVDAGVNIPHDKKVFPSKEKIEGENVKKGLKDLIKKIKGEIK
jgi:large subunit ribosomal protein L18